MWARLCNFTKKQASSQIFAKTLLKLSKLLFCRLSRWWLLLVLDKNSRRQFLILINASASRDIDFHETSKTTALIEQALVVHGTPCFFYDRSDTFKENGLRGNTICNIFN